MILFCHFNCNTKLTIPTLAKCGSLIGGGLTAANIKEKLFMPKDNTNKYAGKVIIDESLIDKRLQPLLTIQQNTTNRKQDKYSQQNSNVQSNGNNKRITNGQPNGNNQQNTNNKFIYRSDDQQTQNPVKHTQYKYVNNYNELNKTRFINPIINSIENKYLNTVLFD